MVISSVQGLENTKSEDINRLQENHESLQEALIDAFDWYLSPEGRYYWSGLAKAL